MGQATLSFFDKATLVIEPYKMGKPRVRTSVICVHNNRLLCFNAEDPKSKAQFVFLPGGLIEAHETAPEAAIRETLEETGFHVDVDADFSVDSEYAFHWNGEDYDCLTIFYRAKLASPLQGPVTDATYHRGVVWIEVNRIPEVFAYSEPIRDAILELVQAPGGTN